MFLRALWSICCSVFKGPGGSGWVRWRPPICQIPRPHPQLHPHRRDGEEGHGGGVCTARSHCAGSTYNSQPIRPPYAWIYQCQLLNVAEVTLEVCDWLYIILSKDICDRVASEGGAALIADYGHDGEKEDTLRAFHKHKVGENWQSIEDLYTIGTLTVPISFNTASDYVREFVLTVRKEAFDNINKRNHRLVPRSQHQGDGTLILTCGWKQRALLNI